MIHDPHDHEGAGEHEHEHAHDHDHPHAPIEAREPQGHYHLLADAVRELLIEKGYFTADQHRAFIETIDSRSPAVGARIVAKAWTDSAFKRRLLDDGKKACAELGIDVYGMNLFRDILGTFRDVVGGRSQSHQKLFRDARNTVLLELKREALMVEADAVLGIRLNYSEIDGGGKNGLLMAAVSGTAVKLKDSR